MALVAAMIAFRTYPARVSRGASRSVGNVVASPTQPLAALRRTLLAEFLLGLLFIGLGAVFGSMSPTMV
ncbi:MAG: hypothetical protein U1D06_02270 [Paracoccaceae bacterium]|nr:hypothetical protein [Erythrobacter sp.]MDZ4134406.1 hypothetical protein [Paracoccaceae bacterium]